MAKNINVLTVNKPVNGIFLKIEEHWLVKLHTVDTNSIPVKILPLLNHEPRLAPGSTLSTSLPFLNTVSPLKNFKDILALPINVPGEWDTSSENIWHT